MCSWILKLTQLIYQIEGTRKELACVAGGIVVPGKLCWWRSERRRREGFLRAGGIVAWGTFLAAELPREHEEIYTPNLHFAALSKKSTRPLIRSWLEKNFLILSKVGISKYITAKQAWPIVVCCLVWSNIPIHFSKKSLEKRFVLIQTSICICKVLISENALLILRGRR